MIQLQNKTFIIRKIIATSIIMHGLYRAATITDYVDFVAENFAGTVGNYSLLVIGATILPFLEFLAGALLFMRIGVKRSAILAGIISLVMAVFVIIGHLNFMRLVYHLIILGSLIYIITAYRPIILNEGNFNLSKGKIHSRKYPFFRLW